MAAYLTRRLFAILLVLLGITVVTFFIAQVIPIDPAVAALGENAREEQIAEFRARYGLDRPLPEQYLRYLGRLLQGDLGRSLRTGRPVAEDLAEFFPATLELALASFLVALLLGLPTGILASLYPNRTPDLAVRLGALVLGSTPVFFIAILLLDLLHRHLGLFPGPGRLDPFLLPPPKVTGIVTLDALLAGDLAAFWDALWHLVLPALVLGSVYAALLARMVRAAMLDVLAQDYIRTAWAKGAGPSRVVLRHALKNAALPILTLLGSLLGGLLSGAVLTETIFSWPGLGRYVTQSATSLDFPAVMGVTLLVGVVYSFLNLAVDLLYAWVDPRIRYA